MSFHLNRAVRWSIQLDSQSASVHRLASSLASSHAISVGPKPLVMRNVSNGDRESDGGAPLAAKGQQGIVQPHRSS